MSDEAVRELLGPSLRSEEQLLAAAQTTVPFGYTPDPLPPQRRKPGVVGALDQAYIWSAPYRWFRWLLHWPIAGRTVHGAWDSLAVRCYEACGTPGTSVLLGVTDQRLLLARAPHELGIGEVASPAPLLWQVERPRVTGAGVAWKRLRPGRLRLSFDDGSWIEFADLFAMRTAGARRIRDALA